MTCFEDDYVEERRPIGRSPTVEVFCCRDRHSGKLCATKVYNKNRLDQRRIAGAIAEAQLWRGISPHQNIVQSLNFYDSPDRVSILMEFMPGGTLFQHLMTNGALAEGRACKVIAQLLHGVAHLHSCGIMHRDLKPENVFFRSKSLEDAAGDVVAIGDFGFATRTIPNDSCVGSPQYTAPELALIAMQHHQRTATKPMYNEKCDVWSVGVIAYVMLTRLLPFDGPTPTDVFRAVVANTIRFDIPSCRSLSPDAKAFIAALTESNPSKRPAAKDALRHPWIAGCLQSQR